MSRTAAVVAAAALFGTVACGGPSAQQETVNIFAAASLTGTFERIAADYEDTHPGTDVRLNFGGSSALAAQLVQGAGADVFAAASPEAMRAAERLSDREPVVFVRNRLQIAVPTGNPAKVTGLADFARTELRIALCDVRVPCGTAATVALDDAGVTARPDTLEQDARATLAKVRLGEVDAALVYRTDVISAQDEVKGIDFPQSANAVNDYPVLAFSDAGAAFVAYLRSEPARKVLTDAGFELP